MSATCALWDVPCGKGPGQKCFAASRHVGVAGRGGGLEAQGAY